MSTSNDSEQLQKRIEELEAEIKDLEKDLIHDELTGLKTRAFFEEETKIYLELVANVDIGKRRQWFGFKNLSILFLDIDHFKTVNDTYGHNVGDVVLKEVARTVQNSLREGDTAARWGGEEIVVILLGATESDALTKAEKVLTKIREISFPKYLDLKITSSIGVSSASKGTSFEDLIKQADAAMYKAKESGRNKVVAFSVLES